MGERGDRHLTARSNELEDHLRSQVGLPCARRALDRQDRVIELPNQAQRRALNRCAGRYEVRAVRLACSRWPAKQEVASGAVRPRSLNAVVAYPFADPLEGILLGLGVDRLRRDQRGWMRPRMAKAPLQVQGAVQGVERHHLPG